MQYSFNELRSKISIIELAIANGYVLNRSKGMKWPVLESNLGDKVIIVNPNSISNQGYFNPHDERDKGTLINFVGNRLGDIFPRDASLSKEQNINKVLYQWLSLPFRDKLVHSKTASLSKHGEKVEQAVFSPVLLKPLVDMGYLKARGITESTIKSAAFNGKVLQCNIGNFCNIAFPYQENINGGFVGAEVRNYNFKRHLAGSLRASSVWISNVPESLGRLVICESAIDCMSYYQLKGQTDDLYVSIGGSITQGQLKSIQSMLDKLKLERSFRVVIAVDRDNSGLIYASKIREVFPNSINEYPNGKDYNDDLRDVSFECSKYKH
jgi:hypothetical protein